MSIGPILMPLDEGTNALEKFSLEKNPSVSLADLKSSGLRFQWYEAVAIAQAVSRTILGSGDQSGPAKLKLDAVTLDETGRVSVHSSGPRSAPAAVQALGNLLSDFLPSNDLMLLKVKVVAKATASPPLYRSLAEFSQELAYFERPNQTQVLQAVYDRWRNNPAPKFTAPM